MVRTDGRARAHTGAAGERECERKTNVFCSSLLANIDLIFNLRDGGGGGGDITPLPLGIIYPLPPPCHPPAKQQVFCLQLFTPRRPILLKEMLVAAFFCFLNLSYCDSL